MSKEQQQKTARETLLSHVAALTKKIEAASEDELKAWAGKLDAESNLKAEADKAATEEKAIAEKSTGENTAAAADGQNARANANWPARSATMAASLVELARRDAKTASVMLAKAKEIVADDDEEDDCVACKAAAQNLVKMASARTKTASDMMQMARDIMGDEDEKKSMPPWLEKKIGDKEANTKIAAQLVALAKKVVADDEEPEEDESGKEVAAALVELAKTLSETKD